MFPKRPFLFKEVIILSLFILLLTNLSAQGQNESSEEELNVQEILSQYDAQSLSKNDVLTIHETFRNAGIKGGPELDEIIRTNGFDPEMFKTQVPPPGGKPEMNEDKKEKAVPVFSLLTENYNSGDFVLTSTAIDQHGELLDQYKCETKKDGIEKSIPLSWDNVPDKAESLAIVMYHYPHENDHTHVNSYLLLWGINPSVNKIPYGMADKGDWYMGSNKDGDAVSYTSPCSKSPGSHNYTITLFALSETPADLPSYSTKEIDFEAFMTALEKAPIISKTELDFIDIRK